MKINWFKIDKYIVMDFSESVITIVKSAMLYDYVKLKIYLKQGWDCRDCNKSYLHCNCNYCEKCYFRICLCEINEKTPNEKEKLIRKKTILLIKQILSKNEIEKLKKILWIQGIDLRIRI